LGSGEVRMGRGMHGRDRMAEPQGQLCRG
jgi:hypothetical protein